MIQCPKCGHEFTDDAKAKAGHARWHGVSKAERSALASKAAKARWKAVKKDKQKSASSRKK